MIYWAIIIVALYFIISSLWVVIRAKNKKLAIKEQINMIVTPTIMFLPMHFVIITVFVMLGCEYVKENTYSLLQLNLVDSVEYGMIFIMTSGLIIILHDVTEPKGRKSQYKQWISNFNSNGLIRYTEEEKAIRKIEHEQWVAKCRAKFPKITEWFDKYHKVV